MKILYHLTFLPPPIPDAVAELQEINALRRAFGGDLIYLNPNSNAPFYIPRLAFGFHQLRTLRKREADLNLHHVYNADPFAFPVLRLLRRPVVYSISGGVGDKRPQTRFFNSLAAVLVSDSRSFKRLTEWGLNNVFQVRPGIDTSRFTHTPCAMESRVKLMVGSAPWTHKQFQTKGIDALLSAAQQMRHLHLVFLWRGVLAQEMEHRVRRLNLTKQVVVINKRVNVNEILAGVHASITLAAASGIVKAYPNSLLDSLAAGKPVLVSRAIPMADHVEQTGCGKVIDRLAPLDILTAIESLMREYEDLQRSAQRVGQRDFSRATLIDSFKTVYDHLIDPSQPKVRQG